MPMRRDLVGILACLALSTATGCGSTQSIDGRSLSLEYTRVGSAFRYVRRSEVESFQGQSLGEALRHLRPDWLRANTGVREPGDSPRAVVYTNDVPSGELAALEMIPAGAVAEVRLLSALEARVRYGSNCRCLAGVILVRTRTDE